MGVVVTALAVTFALPGALGLAAALRLSFREGGLTRPLATALHMLELA